MVAQLKDGTPTRTDQKLPIDPLRRVFVPIERRNVDDTYVFQTSDKTRYMRVDDGSIHRATPKLRGKAARRAERRARRK